MFRLHASKPPQYRKVTHYQLCLVSDVSFGTQERRQIDEIIK